MFTLQHKTDVQIRTDVADEIKWDPSISSSNIDVSSYGGVITLTGHVPHYCQKSTAVKAAQRIGGVRGVTDQLSVDLVGSHVKTDDQIAEAALKAFEWNYSIPKEVRMYVEKGWVTVSGQVEWNFQRTAAIEAVSHLLGVCGVTDNVNIRTKVHGSDIKTKIESAIGRCAERARRDIQVFVEGDTVILQGSLRSFAEIQDVRLAAWMVPGVIAVDSQLNIA